IEAVVRLQGIAKNLTLEPQTRHDVGELESWIRADDVITRVEQPNPWGLAVNIRERLLPALAELKPKLPE
ncbi:MAG: hypothetical protein KDC98_08995, partial [Planctomycetes bacterium]|nr:hypothetical protein [Planctomycetota bacterium]